MGSLSMKFTPYVMFQGQCAEAFACYAKLFDARIVRLLRFSQAPAGVPLPPGANPDLVMHACLEKDGFRLMGGDMSQDCGAAAQAPLFWVSIAVESVEEANRVADQLAEGGQVFMPPGETFFSQRFAMVQDRYGIRWMVDCPRSEAELAALG
jgi:PhnB protein